MAQRFRPEDKDVLAPFIRVTMVDDKYIPQRLLPTSGLGLYKILVYLEAFVHESIILLSPTSTCIARTIAMLLHVYCAIYDAPPDPPFVCQPQHHIGNRNLV